MRNKEPSINQNYDQKRGFTVSILTILYAMHYLDVWSVLSMTADIGELPIVTLKMICQNDRIKPDDGLYWAQI